ncbi:MAG: GTPase [Phycisphaerae bacterium]
MSGSPATRCVLLTPPGSGAIAVIRVAGERADDIISNVFTPTGCGQRPASSGRMGYGTLNRGDEVVDDVLVCRIGGGPEPVWEVCAHGGVRVVERIVELFSEHGACLETADGNRAWDGLAHNAIQRDALSALGRVRTVRGLQFLAWQRANLAEALEGLARRWATDSEGAATELHHMVARAGPARTLLEGAEVAIVGPPNAGKSTLLNRLAGRAAALVSDMPGTTRDWVDVKMEVEGVPLRLVDTAGRRVIGSPIECEAIRRGMAAAGRVDLTLIVLDATCLPEQDPRVDSCGEAAPGRAMVVLNKMDLVPGFAKRVGQSGVPAAHGTPGDSLELVPVLRGWRPVMDGAVIPISAETGHGVAALVDAMLRALGADGDLVGLPTFFCARQVEAARRCLDGAVSQDGDGAALIRHGLIGL